MRCTNAGGSGSLRDAPMAVVSRRWMSGSITSSSSATVSLSRKASMTVGPGNIHSSRAAWMVP